MVYTKPMLTGYSAISVIQSQGQSKKTSTNDSPQNQPSVAAYEADE
jgi:hypothetical protein